MKRTFLAMIMAGSSVALFAQTTPGTPINPATPAPPATATPLNNPSATNNNVTNSTTDPVNTVTNQQTTTGNAAYPSSTSWTPGTSPYWGWNSYGIWNNTPAATGTVNTNSAASAIDYNTGAGINPATNYNAGNSADAYAGTAVSTLPLYVRTNFGRDYPNPANNQYAWNQYGDWFSTSYTGKGRLTQYFYDERGRGYSLSLPVIQTYVPEDVVDKALQKYGARLYSIGMVKTADGKDAYQIGLLSHGQLHNDYLNEEGISVANVWRTEEMNLSSTSANAAMEDQSSVTPVEANTENGSVSAYQDTTKPKMKTKNKHGKMKTKSKGHKSGTDSTSTSPAMKEQ